MCKKDSNCSNSDPHDDCQSNHVSTSEDTSSKKHFVRHANWMYNMLLEPEWIPNVNDVVIHKASKKAALVLSAPVRADIDIDDPYQCDDGYIPMTCTVLLGEEVIDDTPLSSLAKS